MTKSDDTRNGVSDGFWEWLQETPRSSGILVEDGVEAAFLAYLRDYRHGCQMTTDAHVRQAMTDAFGHWLDENTDRLITAIAEAVAERGGRDS